MSNMEKTLFSILIANFNNGKFFKDCYNSIISQTYRNWEVIIIDDCSTDNSLTVIKELIKDDVRFKIYTNSCNRGCGYTKRKCIEYAKGEIFAFLDPDDTIKKEALESMVNAHIESPKASIIYSNLFICNEKLEIQSENKKTQVKNNDPYYTNIGGSISQFSSFKLKLYKKTIGINANYPKAVDQDLYLKLYEVGEAIHLNKSLYYYRHHKNSISLGKRNRDKAFYWHWKALFDASDRRNINFSEEFYNHFLIKKDYMNQLSDYKKIKKSLLFRLPRRLKLI